MHSSCTDANTRSRPRQHSIYRLDVVALCIRPCWRRLLLTVFAFWQTHVTAGLLGLVAKVQGMLSDTTVKQAASFITMARDRSPYRRRSRSRSPDRRRDRSRDRDRDRRRDRSRSRERYRDRDRDRTRRRNSRSRSRSRDRQRHRSRSADRFRAAERDRDVHRRDDDREPSRQPESISTSQQPTTPNLQTAQPFSRQQPQQDEVQAEQIAANTNTAESPMDEKRRRLEAFKAKLATTSTGNQANVSQPTKQETMNSKKQPSTSKPASGLFGIDDDEDDTTAEPTVTAAELIAARKARADAEEAAAFEKKRLKAEAEAAAFAAASGAIPAAYGTSIPAVPTAAATPMDQDEDEVDPLDAFMAGEVLPEVLARQEAERKAKEQERIKHAEMLAAGKVPALPTALSDSDEEPEPDARIQIPRNKVKYVIGPGGSNIQNIQRRSKARIQILKEEEELNRAWGSGSTTATIQQQAQAAMAKVAAQKAAAAKEEARRAKKEAKLAAGLMGETGDQQEGAEEEESSSSEEESTAPGAPPKKMATFLLYGDQKALEIAERMIWEAVDNRVQKKAQREKEYAKKRDEKSRNRQLYYLRHTRDYEMLEVPVGTSKAECKKAYRKLAMLWHPDKHPDNQEEAKAKFQSIQKAYDSLMSTNEEEIIQALGYGR